jgi:tetratricopeptide (TPR) repeat protein
MAASVRAMRPQLVELVVSISRLSLESDAYVEDAKDDLLSLYNNLSDLNDIIKQKEDSHVTQDVALLWSTLYDKILSMVKRTFIIPGIGAERSIRGKQIQIIGKELRLYTLRLRIELNIRPLPAQQYLEKVSNIERVLERLKRDLEDLTTEAKSRESRQHPLPAGGNHDSGYYSPDEAPCLQCIAKQEEINKIQTDNDTTNIITEGYLLEAAQDLRRTGRHAATTRIYEHLRQTRKREVQRKREQRDHAGPDEADRRLLVIDFEEAVMMKESGQLLQAEDALYDLLVRREHLITSQDREMIPAQQDVEDYKQAHSEYCSILRLRGSLGEAEGLHLGEWYRPRMRADYLECLKTDNDWVMHNGYELGCVLDQKGDYEGALKQHLEVLQARQNTPHPDDTSIIQSMVRIIDMRLARGLTGEAGQAFRDYLLPKTDPWTSEIWACAYRVAGALSQKTEYSSARPILQRLWNDAASIEGPISQELSNCGWWLSLSLYNYEEQKEYKEAEEVLLKLLERCEDSNIDHELVLDVRTLLAWTCRRLKNVARAKEYAVPIWEDYHDRSPAGLAALSIGPLMIWICFKEKKCDPGKNAWKQVLAMKEGLVKKCSGEEENHDSIMQTATCWKELSKDLHAWASARGHTPTTARAVRNAAAELEEHCRECKAAHR